ncbi:MAG: ATP-binding protein, partial [Gammaproteobacteria bacterium]|nr:ATP-binding protein [Gammaproteobacteria bacterium]
LAGIEERSNEESSDNLITVRTQHDANRLEIIIKDSGVGMNDEVLSRIFEPLYSTKGFGVGLGMPTVKQIMEQHKGGIDVTSKQGEGTRVTLWLPATCIIKKEERNSPALQNSNDTHTA